MFAICIVHQVWNVSADDQDEMMDEDTLLNEQDLKPSKPKVIERPWQCPISGPETVADAFTSQEFDCETSGGKKACKNCSCGLAEKLAQDEKAAAPTSACGSVSVSHTHPITWIVRSLT
jgi:hypothetical protein